MELYLAEAIKRVKMLNEDMVSLLNEEDTYSTITYRDESEKITNNSFTSIKSAIIMPATETSIACSSLPDFISIW